MTKSDPIMKTIRELILKIRTDKVKAYEKYQDTVTIPVRMHQGMYDELEKAAFKDNSLPVVSWIHCVLFQEAVRHWMNRHPEDSVENQNKMFLEIKPWIYSHRKGGDHET